MAERVPSFKEKESNVRLIKIKKTQETLVSSGLFSSERALIAAKAAVESAGHLSENKSVFPMREWASRFSKLAGDGWLNDPQWGEMRKIIARSVGLMPLADSQQDKDWSVWSPVSHHNAEKEMLELAQRTDDRFAIPEQLALNACAERPTMEEEQKIAAIASCVGNRMVLVTEGTAGAGKSYTLDAIKDVYLKAPPTNSSETEGYDIVGTALSWSAAMVLKESAKLEKAQSLAGLLLEMDNAKENGVSYFKKRTLVIVDEAGLVGTMKMRDLLKHASEAPFPVRVLLTGDSYQLNPVEAGNALEAIVDRCGSSRLDVIRRQVRDSHKAAVKHFCFGRAEQGLWTYWQQESLHLSNGPEERREKVMRDYVEKVAAHPLDSCLVLALENAEVKRLNENIREKLKEAGLLAGDEHELEVNDGYGPFKAKFCVGDRIVFRKNLREQAIYESKHDKLHEGVSASLEKGKKQEDSGLFSKMLSNLAGGKQEPLGKQVGKGIFNRSAGIILGISKSPSGPRDRVLRIMLRDGGEVDIDTADLRDKYAEKSDEGIAIHHNFATTVYSSQGQTVDRVLLMDSKNMNRRLAYVGMSRHKIQCDVYADYMDLDQRRRLRATREMNFTWSKKEKEKCSQIINTEKFEEADLWAEMALCWNNESDNPTVDQMLKRMADKKNKAKDGTETGRLHASEEDDADDLDHQGLPKIPYQIKPISYDILLSRVQNRKIKSRGLISAMFGSSKVEPEIKQNEDDTSTCLPDWCKEPLAAESLSIFEHVLWGRNLYGEPRLFALDTQGKPVSRWSFDGNCMAGRKEIPVLKNTDESPWMLVQGPREAMISWSHFQKKYQENSFKAPSIAIGFEEADWNSLLDWVKPGQIMHCAWSPKNPESLFWAKKSVSRLLSLGFHASVYPKEPEVQLGHVNSMKI